MQTLHCDALVIGAGPAGLSAAAELAGRSADVLLIDANSEPGGQLNKQIHKFFGTVEHGAGVRGFRLAEQLTRKAAERGVRLLAGVRAVGAFSEGVVVADSRGDLSLVESSCGVVAVGAAERGVAFPGWTLPGVMTAGAAQTLVNSHRVAIGSRVMVVGAGNVGLIVAYQLHQAGIHVVAIVEAQAEIGGWAVHASKIRRLGIPILVNARVAAVRGPDLVRQVTVHVQGETSAVNSWSEETLDVDAICLAVGMSPRTELLQQLGCRLVFASALGGPLAQHNRQMETTVPGWFVAGDAAGVEEAAVAMEEGRLAALGACRRLGTLGARVFEAESARSRDTLHEMRSGPFGRERDMAKRALHEGAS